MKKITLKTNDGYSLSVNLAIPKQPESLLILCHGITVDSTEGGFFLDYENDLLDNNILVVRFDFRCHGQSSGEPKELTLAGEYIDVQTVYEYCMASYNLPLFIQATSFSGSAVINLYSKEILNMSGLILWNAIIDYKGTFLKPSTPWVRSILETCGSDIPNWAFAKIPGTKYYLTKKLVDEFSKDRTKELLASLKQPFIAFHGDMDTKIPCTDIKDISIKNKHLKLYILEGEAHGFKGKREFVKKETIKWIKSKLDKS